MNTAALQRSASLWPLALLAVWPLRLAAARARRRGTQGVANSGGAS